MNKYVEVIVGSIAFGSLIALPWLIYLMMEFFKWLR